MQESSDAEETYLIVDISNKGMDSTKLLKDQVFLKVCRTYHATLESWIRNHQLIRVKTHRC